MTICIATSNFPPQTGGIATFGYHLAALLVQQGHRVIVLTPGDTTADESNDSINTDGNISVVHLREHFRSYRKEYEQYFPAGSLDAPYWIAAGLAMRNWLLEHSRQYNIDIIEAGDYGGAGIFLCDQRLPPLVLTGHGSFVQLKRFNAVNPDTHTAAVAEFEILSYREADGVIAHSRLNQDELNAYNKNKVYLAAAPWQLKEWPRQEEETTPIVIAGGLQKVKGAILLAEALKWIHAGGRSVQVLWAGGDSFTAPGGGKMSEYLEKRFPEIWQKEFCWTGELSAEETLHQLSRAALVIIPSAWEAFSYVALEAAAMGKALVITDTTGASTLFTHEKDAWIIPAGDARKLAGAMLQLQPDEQLRHTLGTNAAATVQRLYTETDTTGGRVAVYREIIEARKKRITFPVSPDVMLKKYRGTVRKLYYSAVKWLKKLAGKN